MFDIGFSELFLVFVIGLVVLGPKRLPVAVKTVVGWIRAMRSMAANVQNELAQELKLQELQDSLKKVEQASKDSISPELKSSMDELKQSAESLKRSYLGDPEKAHDEEAHTIHNPLVKNPADAHDGATPAKADHQASAPAQTPVNEAPAPEPVIYQSQASTSPADTSSSASVQAPQQQTSAPAQIPQPAAQAEQDAAARKISASPSPTHASDER